MTHSFVQEDIEEVDEEEELEEIYPGHPVTFLFHYFFMKTPANRCAIYLIQFKI